MQQLLYLQNGYMFIVMIDIYRNVMDQKQKDSLMSSNIQAVMTKMIVLPVSM